MVFETWQDACAHFSKALDPVSDEQQQLAQHLGLGQFAKRTPALVAGARLRVALGPTIGLEGGRPPSFGQDELLDLLEDYQRPSDARRIETFEEASAWITIRDRRRTIAALKRLRLKRNDIVSVDSAEGRLAIVSSISSNGFVMFQGHGGQRARPHRLVKVADATDDGDSATEARQVALNHSAERFEFSRSTRLVHLDPYLVSGFAGPHEAALLETCLEEAKDERPLQELLTRHPQILAGLVRSTHGTWVVPWPRLGTQHVPDFAIGTRDSIGMSWLLVEIESPRAPTSLKLGDEAEKLRHALAQVKDWRHWIRENPDLTKRPPSEGGAGLSGARSDSPALILIGRRGPEPDRFNRIRSDHQAARVDIHSYDWLFDVTMNSKHPLLEPDHLYY